MLFECARVRTCSSSISLYICAYLLLKGLWAAFVYCVMCGRFFLRFCLCGGRPMRPMPVYPHAPCGHIIHFAPFAFATRAAFAPRRACFANISIFRSTCGPRHTPQALRAQGYAAGVPQNYDTRDKSDHKTSPSPTTPKRRLRRYATPGYPGVGYPAPGLGPPLSTRLSSCFLEHRC